MPELTVEFEVFCGKCGEGLCRNTKTDAYKHFVTVDPCEKCLDNERDKGYEEGYKKAEEDAKE